MQISSFSDYTLRILLYLAVAGDRQVTSRQIAERYNLSFDHIAKAAQLLTREGYVIAARGRGGGLRLARSPDEISIGAILRVTEAGSGLVECMRPGPTSCIIAKVCGLAPILAEANEAFYRSLDAKTLADALPDYSALVGTFEANA
ncbi:MAG: RrF2 family transcriptional regulator [Geminicoccaceae bacterium]